MPNEDRDWLEERIAMQNYIPDDGFTARVMTRLPQARSHAVANVRQRILSLSIFLAACLLIVQLVTLALGITRFAARFSPMAAMSQIAHTVQQPIVLYGVAGGIILLAFVSIPLIRRVA